jgi:hypothetical protein
VILASSQVLIDETHQHTHILSSEHLLPSNRHQPGRVLHNTLIIHDNIAFHSNSIVYLVLYYRHVQHVDDERLNRRVTRLLCDTRDREIFFIEAEKEGL